MPDQVPLIAGCVFLLADLVFESKSDGHPGLSASG
jgi:hypothetical protein